MEPISQSETEDSRGEHKWQQGLDVMLSRLRRLERTFIDNINGIHATQVFSQIFPSLPGIELIVYWTSALLV
jgi:hypothetical protein